MSQRLEEIKDEIKDLLEEAKQIVRKDDRAWQQAKSYWYAHIVSALDKDHDYLGSSMITMQDTIDKLEDLEDEDSDDVDEDDDE